MVLGQGEARGVRCVRCSALESPRNPRGDARGMLGGIQPRAALLDQGMQPLANRLPDTIYKPVWHRIYCRPDKQPVGVGVFYLATEPRRKLTSGDKTLIVKHWLAGDSLRQIQDVFRKRGVPPPSTSTGSEVIAEAKRTDPDLESMRQLLVDLRKIGGDVNSALRGCVVLDQLHESGFTMKDWDKVLSLCLEIFAGRPVEVVDPATELLKLEKVTGKTYTELLRDYERMSREVPELSEKIGGLAAKKQGLEQSIRRLEEYARLSEDLRKQDVAPEDVAKFLKVYKDHDQLGLDRYSKVLGGAESLQHALAALGTREKEERARVEALEKQRSLLQQRVDKLAEERRTHEECRKSFAEEAEQIHAQWRQAKRDLATSSR